MRHREIRTLVNNCSVQLQRLENAPTQEKYPVINISRGGICFQSNDNFELNEVVEINLCVKQHSVHNAKGRICYHKQQDTKDTSHYGLSFLDNFIDTDVLRSDAD